MVFVWVCGSCCSVLCCVCLLDCGGYYVKFLFCVFVLLFRVLFHVCLIVVFVWVCALCYCVIWCVCLLDCGIFYVKFLFCVFVLLFRVLLHVCFVLFIVVFVWFCAWCCCLLCCVCLLDCGGGIYVKFLFCVCLYCCFVASSCLFGGLCVGLCLMLLCALVCLSAWLWWWWYLCEVFVLRVCTVVSCFFISVVLLWSLCGFVLDVAVYFVVSVCVIVVVVFMWSFCFACVCTVVSWLLHVFSVVFLWVCAWCCCVLWCACLLDCGGGGIYVKFLFCVFYTVVLCLLHVCLFGGLCVGMCFMLLCDLSCLSAWLWWLLCEDMVLWFCWLVVSVFKSVLISDCARILLVMCVIVFYCVVVYWYGWYCIQSAQIYTTSAYTLHHYDKLVSAPTSQSSCARPIVILFVYLSFLNLF